MTHCLTENRKDRPAKARLVGRLVTICWVLSSGYLIPGLLAKQHQSGLLGTVSGAGTQDFGQYLKNFGDAR